MHFRAMWPEHSVDMSTFPQSHVDLIIPFLYEEEKVQLFLSCASLTSEFAFDLQEIRECAFLFDFWESHFYWDLSRRGDQLQRDFDEAVLDQDPEISD